MYLIDITTLKLKWYADAGNCPRYAILSHRWTNDEITFKDFMKGRRKESEGYKKIVDLCAAIRADNLKEDGWGRILKQPSVAWAWVDTCCIDKRSSAELQEAINSMFGYYRGAAKCYVHLADVDGTAADEDFDTQFVASEWFTRGWTLQELVAPSTIAFHDKEWRYLGTLMDGWGTFRIQGDFLSDLVSRASGIQTQFLHYVHSPESQSSLGHSSGYASVACRMSWASARRTTRGEDEAYCLLGLFGVNMPLSYGEGKRKAFLRLQEEIMKTSDDHSIFAWNSWGSKWRDPEVTTSTHGLLADYPSWFSGSHRVRPSTPHVWADTDPHTLTSRGLKIVLPLAYIADDIYLAKLDCIDGETGESTNQSLIPLRKMARNKRVFQRFLCGKSTLDLSRIPSGSLVWISEAIYVRQDDPSPWSLRKGSKYFMNTIPWKSDYRLSTITLDPYTRSIVDEPAKDEGGTAVHLVPPEGRLGGTLFHLGPSEGEFPTLLLKHNTGGNEELVINFAPLAPLSPLFLGFHVCLASDLGGTTILALEELKSRTVGAPLAQWQYSLLDPTWISPISRPRPHRLGSRVCVPSMQDPEWCHSVEVAIESLEKDEQILGAREYLLTLKVDYRRRICDGEGADAGCAVIPPSGYITNEDEHMTSPHPSEFHTPMTSLSAIQHRQQPINNTTFGTLCRAFEVPIQSNKADGTYSTPI